jgi:hypothetical protein
MEKLLAAGRGRLTCARWVFHAREVWQSFTRIAGRSGSLDRVEGKVEPETATRLGAAEAEVADLNLRLKESQDREKRLVERVFTAEEQFDDALSTEHELRIQIQRYAEFNRALQRSRPWRMIQFLRRLVGREW